MTREEIAREYDKNFLAMDKFFYKHSVPTKLKNGGIRFKIKPGYKKRWKEFLEIEKYWWHKSRKKLVGDNNYLCEKCKSSSSCYKCTDTVKAGKCSRVNYVLYGKKV